MTYHISRAAVIGAGIMGAGIAAHLANVGIPVTAPRCRPARRQGFTDRAARNRLPQTGLDRARSRPRRPRPSTSHSPPELVTVGNIEDDLARLGEVNWIVEAVFEQLDVKHDLYARIEAVRRPGTIISSNTSGLPRAPARSTGLAKTSAATS